MQLSLLVDLTVGGLTVGMIYALVALGYTMVYGVLEFINFAHGEVFTVGGYIVALVLLQSGVQPGASLATRIMWLLIALAVAIPLTALLGLVIERVAYRPLRGSSRIIPLQAAPDEQEEQRVYPLDTARLRRVVEMVAEKSGWGKRAN